MEAILISLIVAASINQVDGQKLSSVSGANEGGRLRALTQVDALSMSVAGIGYGGGYGSGGVTKSKAEKSAAKAAKVFKEPECSLQDLAGSFALSYDFYSSEAGDYAFPDSTAALTFAKPNKNGKPIKSGSGVMVVNYCWGDDNANDMVAVQTGFAKDNIIPIKIVKYEDEQTVEKLYNEYTFTGEYDCKSETLLVGFASYFEGNAYTIKPAMKDGDLELTEAGCLKRESDDEEADVGVKTENKQVSRVLECVSALTKKIVIKEPIYEKELNCHAACNERVTKNPPIYKDPINKDGVIKNVKELFGTPAECHRFVCGLKQDETISRNVIRTCLKSGGEPTCDELHGLNGLDCGCVDNCAGRNDDGQCSAYNALFPGNEGGGDNCLDQKVCCCEPADSDACVEDF